MTPLVSEEIINDLASGLDEEKYDDAAAQAERLTIDHPDDPRPWRVLVHCLIAQNRFRPAFRTLTRMLELHSPEELKVQSTYFGAGQFFAAGLQRRLDLVVLLGSAFIGVGAAEIGGRLGLLPALAFTGTCLLLGILCELIARTCAAYQFGLPGEGLVAPMLKAKPGIAFNVYDRPIYQYDDTFGFHHVPNVDAVQITIAADGIVERSTVVGNSRGNLEPSDDSFQSDKLNVLVIGDSFTCLPGNGDEINGVKNVEWPHLMKVFIEGQIGLDRVRVINFGRISCGVMQMMDQAARLANSFNPDILIFAFITRDLDRPRRYISNLNIANVQRQMIHFDRTPNPDLLHARDMGLIDPRAAAVQPNLNPSALIDELRARHDFQARRTSGRTFRLWDPRRSVFLDRLLTGTFFTRFDLRAIDYKAPIAVVDLTSYQQDPRFMESLAALKETGVHVIYAHLPEAHELKKRQFVPRSAAAVSLFQSFAKLIGQPIHFLSHFIDIPEEDVTNRFRRKEYDEHPSLWTKTIYADLISQIVLNECKADPLLSRKVV